MGRDFRQVWDQPKLEQRARRSTCCTLTFSSQDQELQFPDSSSQGKPFPSTSSLTHQEALPKEMICFPALACTPMCGAPAASSSHAQLLPLDHQLLMSKGSGPTSTSDDHHQSSGLRHPAAANQAPWLWDGSSVAGEHSRACWSLSQRQSPC